MHKYYCHVELSFHTALKYVLLRVLLRVSLPRHTEVPVAAYSIALPSRSGEQKWRDAVASQSGALQVSEELVDAPDKWLVKAWWRVTLRRAFLVYGQCKRLLWGGCRGVGGRTSRDIDHRI